MTGQLFIRLRRALAPGLVVAGLLLAASARADSATDAEKAAACAVLQTIADGTDICTILGDFVSLVPGGQQAIDDRVHHIFNDVGGLNDQQDPRAGVGNGGAPTSDYECPTPPACPWGDPQVATSIDGCGTSCICPPDTVMLNFPSGTPVGDSGVLDGERYFCRPDCPAGRKPAPDNRSCVVACPSGRKPAPDNQSCVLACPWGQKPSPDQQSCVRACPWDQTLSSDGQTCVPMCPDPATKLRHVCDADFCLRPDEVTQVWARVAGPCPPHKKRLCFTPNGPIVHLPADLEAFGSGCVGTGTCPPQLKWSIADQKCVPAGKQCLPGNPACDP